ncbi:hypothetical protein DPMN_165703 [Dreissena polymorpha]|uniref:Uncharacterized protein n=1 Tax=Dreissena polymorpha TaxID=45954 RepID=A0A9D4F165_DREPO|nr:hypothetical protein DPMN_165703 [Dreissena polymorpha]
MILEIIASANANRAQPGQTFADKLIQHPVDWEKEIKESLKRAIRRAKRGTIPAKPDTISSIPKQQEHNEEFLTAILDACLREDTLLSPSTVIIDYETAIHNAVLTVINQVMYLLDTYDLDSNFVLRQMRGIAVKCDMPPHTDAASTADSAYLVAP